MSTDIDDLPPKYENPVESREVQTKIVNTQKSDYEIIFGAESSEAHTKVINTQKPDYEIIFGAESIQKENK